MHIISLNHEDQGSCAAWFPRYLDCLICNIMWLLRCSLACNY